MRRRIIILSLLTLTIGLARVSYLHHLGTKPYERQLLLSAKKDANNKAIPEIVDELARASGGFRELGRVLKTEPSVLSRLAKKKTSPTPLMEDNIKALYIEFLARESSWATIRWMFRASRFDPYTAYHDPLREQSVLTEEGSGQN